MEGHHFFLDLYHFLQEKIQSRPKLLVFQIEPALNAYHPAALLIFAAAATQLSVDEAKVLKYRKIANTTRPLIVPALELYPHYFTEFSNSTL